MINNELRAKLESQAEKLELRGKDKDALIEWAERVECGHNILENIDRGFMEVAKWENGEPQFSMTPAGMKYVENMPRNG